MKAGDLVMYKKLSPDDFHLLPCMEKLVGIILSFEVNSMYFDNLYSAISSEEAAYSIVYAVILWGDDRKISWELEHEIEVISESR